MQRGERVGGRFEVIAEVGRGGMGTVYRGRDVRTRRDVAIKRIAAETPDEAARFAREVEILAGVRHPGIVGYVAHGPGYLVMEWVEGETLRQRLDRAALSVPGAVAIARQLAAALAALHAAGIVHRDVKPDNIMLAAEQVKLVDFGVARGALGPRVTMTGACVGTAGYMAPEQARGDREITGAADQFALGCVLYECLAGDRGARLVEQLAIARAAGDTVAGAWLDASAAQLGGELAAELAAELTIERHGGRLRLRGPA